MNSLSRLVTLALILTTLSAGPSSANQTDRITNLEKRITALEKELVRLKAQEKRASKYLKCVQNVEGNAVTIPFKLLNCIRK